VIYIYICMCRSQYCIIIKILNLYSYKIGRFVVPIEMVNYIIDHNLAVYIYIYGGKFCLGICRRK
jgi:hypothetical protein